MAGETKHTRGASEAREPEIEEALDRPEREGSAETESQPSELELAIREREEMRRSWQRAQADYQNLKRRTLADIEAAVRRAKTPLLENILLIQDYLEMALAMECRTEEARNLAVGVQMTRDQLAGVLEREGVTRIPTDGDFDPAVHQAVATVETDEVPAGRILGVRRTGWKAGDLVLRPAHVEVAAAPTDARAGDAPGNRADDSQEG